MRKAKLRVAAAVAALLLFLTASVAFASKPKKTHSTEQQHSAIYGDGNLDPINDNHPLSDVVVTLELNDQPKAVHSVEHEERPTVAGVVGSVLEQARNQISKLAQRFIGTPYRWGGMTPKAFDCSGFTCYLFGKMGVKLPRTARQQYKTGQIVKAGELKKGDLVFFDMMKGYVSHVGVYLGGGKFIHASTPKSGVRIDSLSAPSYKNRFVGARRHTLSLANGMES